MTTSFPRLIAAALLLVGGGIVALSVLAVAVSRIAVAVGLRVSATPADIALLDDLIQVAPFVGAFAVANLVAAIALVVGSTWADRLTSTLAAVAVGIGLFVTILLTLGNASFAAVPIIGPFISLYGAVILALAVDGKPVVMASNVAAA